MATSTSKPDDTGAAPPEPRRETLDSIAAQIAAIDLLIGRAEHSIRVFDIDLSQTGWNDAQRADALAAFLRRSRLARLDIVVHDTGWIERSCSRLTHLLRYYSHGITIYRTGESARHAIDPLVIVDNRHVLHRLSYEHPRAVLIVDDPVAAQPLVERFEEIWASAEPGINATVLGL